MKHSHEMTGEELIRAVAEDVMGGRENNYFFSEEHGLAFGPIPNDPQHRLQVWNPLTNANHRDMVVERMVGLGWQMQLWRMKEDFRVVFYHEYRDWRELRERDYKMNINLGRAVCEAALEATKT